LWDMKYGDLHGDRRHNFKIYGAHALKWNASVGANFFFQSGQPWETLDYHFYQPLVGTSTSDTIRNTEPAGSRRSPNHHQLDLKYIQNLPTGPTNLQVSVDFYNVYNKRTGYNINPSLNSSTYSSPLNAWDPRRFELTFKASF